MHQKNPFHCGSKADGQTLLIQFNLAGSITFNSCSETVKHNDLVFFVVGDKVFKGLMDSDEGFGYVGLYVSKDAGGD